MIRGVFLGLAIVLIAIGIKGFTPAGLPLSKSRTLSGNPARVVGLVCILAGLGLFPLFLVVVWAFNR